MKRIVSLMCIVVVIASFIAQSDAITGPWVKPAGRKRSILDQVSIIISLFESTGWMKSTIFGNLLAKQNNLAQM